MVEDFGGELAGRLYASEVSSAPPLRGNRNKAGAISLDVAVYDLGKSQLPFIRLHVERLGLHTARLHGGPS